MFGNGIDFNGTSPMMEGTWYNPDTGDSFTVRDCFFENDNYLVTTTDGRTLGYDTIQRYIKSDGPIRKPENPAKTMRMSRSEMLKGLDKESAAELAQISRNTSSSPKPALEAADESFLRNLDNDDFDVLNTPIYNGTTSKAPVQKPVPTKSVNYEIVDRVLKKTSFEPNLDVNINQQSVDTLVNMLGVESKEIAEYIADKILDRDGTISLITKQLNAMLGIEEKEPEQEMLEKGFAAVVNAYENSAFKASADTEPIEAPAQTTPDEDAEEIYEDSPMWEGNKPQFAEIPEYVSPSLEGKDPPKFENPGLAMDPDAALDEWENQ